MVHNARNKTATLRDIAEVVGYSVNTVSLALRRLGQDSQRDSNTHIAGGQEAGVCSELCRSQPDYASKRHDWFYTGGLHDAVRIEMVNCLIENLHTAEYRPVLGLGQRHAGPWHDSLDGKTFQALNVEAIVIVSDSPERCLCGLSGYRSFLSVLSRNGLCGVIVWGWTESKRLNWASNTC